jgi:hypothetical protein
MIAVPQSSVPHPCDFCLSQGWETTIAGYSISVFGLEPHRPRGQNISGSLPESVIFPTLQIIDPALKKRTWETNPANPAGLLTRTAGLQTGCRAGVHARTPP